MLWTKSELDFIEENSEEIEEFTPEGISGVFELAEYNLTVAFRNKLIFSLLWLKGGSTFFKKRLSRGNDNIIGYFYADFTMFKSENLPRMFWLGNKFLLARAEVSKTLEIPSDLEAENLMISAFMRETWTHGLTAEITEAVHNSKWI